jgi:predicted nucleic acid-binding Zn ribbon protein
MPTYVYKFVETGETIEVQQAFSDDALTEAAHPQTGAVMAVKKVFTPVGVTFKGDGFYKTDSRSSGSGKAKAAASSSDGAASSGDSTSSDTTSKAPEKSSTPSTSSPSSSSSSSSSSSD